MQRMTCSLRFSLLNTACIHCCHPREDVVTDTGQRVMIMSFQIVRIFHKQSYVINCLFRFSYWFYIACIHTLLCVYVCYMLLINTLTLTLKYFFIWSFRVSVWFKHSKHALNIDSNDHQIKQETHKKRRHFKTTKKKAQKTMFITNVHKCLI